MNNNTSSFNYDFTILSDFSEVCRSPRETRLYTKYFPVLAEKFATDIIYPGAYRVTVRTNELDEVIDLTYKKVVYTIPQIILGILTSRFKK